MPANTIDFIKEKKPWMNTKKEKRGRGNEMKIKYKKNKEKKKKKKKKENKEIKGQDLFRLFLLPRKYKEMKTEIHRQYRYNRV